MDGEGKWALISVTDKSGVIEFARGLVELGYRVLSSGGTAKLLSEAGLKVTKVGDFTQFPEILGGRVKTLHPKIHAGILARKGNPEDAETMRQRDIPCLDVVAVNLYAFENAVASFDAAHAGATLESIEDPAVADVVEQIDIGGPTLVRAAAKNSARVTVVVDPEDYAEVLNELRSGGTPARSRTLLAAKAFARIARYDREIDQFFARVFGTDQAAESELFEGDDEGQFVQRGAVPLRYGENPHQAAYFLRAADPGEASVVHARVRQGKELSYNNLLDAEAALELVKEFEQPAAVVIKHTNPCGAAVAPSALDAFLAAYSGDPRSAFGGILALNRPLDPELCERIATRDHFFEVLIAPQVDDACLEILQRGAPWGKNLRVLECGETRRCSGTGSRWSKRSLVGGWLIQERDRGSTPENRVVTRRSPSAEEFQDLEFAWRVVQHVRSNAIVLARNGTLLGVGAGQMSRVDSVEIAVGKAGERSRGAVMASDAFFPFRDGVDTALRAGISAVIQPGGSRRDQESIDACDESAAAMVFTGIRHFLH